jgi:hypothetical protein
MQDEWNDGYSRYSTALEILGKTHAGNNALLKSICDYLMTFKGQIEDLVTAATDLAPSSATHSATIITPIFQATNPVSAGRSPPLPASRSGSDILDSKSFDEVSSYNVSHFKTAARDLLRHVIAPFHSFQAEYNSRMESLLQKLTASLSSLDESRSRFWEAYPRYIKARTDVIAAYDAKSPDLSDAQHAFMSAHKAAFGTHTLMNELTAQAAKVIELGLTEYEEIEQWRFRTLQECIMKLGAWCQRFSGEVQQGMTAYSDVGKLIPPDPKLDEIMSCATLQKPDADDAFALLRLDPRITMFLDKSQMFLEEQRRGLKLYRTLKSVVGKGDGLSVWVGEVVCALSVTGTEITAVNINGSKGKVPSAALSPYY